MISTEAKRIKSCNPVTFPVPASSSPIVVADDKSTINRNKKLCLKRNQKTLFKKCCLKRNQINETSLILNKIKVNNIIIMC